MDPIICTDCGRPRTITTDGCCGIDDCINFLRLTRLRYEAAIKVISKEIDWLAAQGQASVSIYDVIQSVKEEVDKVKA